MPSDDEFRRVAEDVRALARSLARDVRGAVDRGREDPGPGQHDHDPVSAARRIAREEVRRARQAYRQAPWGRRCRGAHWHSYWRSCRRDVPGRRARPGSDSWGRPGSRSQERNAPAASDDGFDRAERSPVSTLARGPGAAPLPPLRHRHDGSTVLGLLAVVFGLAWLAGGTRVIDISAEGVLAVAVMVLGVAMVITARTDWALSRRSWPVMLGGLLLVGLIVSSSSPSLASDLRNLQFGSRTVRASAWADVPFTIEGGVGQTVVDLSAIPVGLPGPRTLEVDGGVGNLVIRLPANLAVMVDAHVGAGSIMVDGANVASGFRPSYHQALDPGAAGPTLTLRVRSGVGAVRVLEPVPS